MKKTASLIILILCSQLSAAERPILKAVTVNAAPIIDGDLSDACWKVASSVSDFYVTEDGTSAKEPTIAWVCFDSKNLYLAFDCKESQPDKIMAQQKKRGGTLSTDDWVGFDLDVYDNQSTIVWFDVSAGGVQLENLQTGDISKIEWKGDWNAGAKRTPDGYDVEMAIPFSILQYHRDQSSMGIAFIRRHIRLDQWWWSPNVGPNCDARKFYKLDGLVLPKRDNKPKLMAYGLLGTGQDTDVKRMGLDIKHSFTPSVTGLLTLNPYFGDVEQQVESIDFTYNERYLSDSRPFFQEGTDYFPASGIYYTRRIKDIDAGAEVHGKVGNYGLAFMNVRKFGDEDHTIAQIGHTWPNKAWLWLAGTRSKLPGVDNYVSYGCGCLTLYDKRDQRWKMAASVTRSDSTMREGEVVSKVGGDRMGVSLWLRTRPRVVSFDMGYDFIDSGHNPYLGYVPEKGLRNLRFSTSIYDEPSSGRLSYLNTSLSMSMVRHLDGSLYHSSISLDHNRNWRNGAGMYIGLYAGNRPPYQDGFASLSYWWGQRDLYRNGNVGVAFGRQAGGSYLSWGVGRGWSISDKLSLNANYGYTRIRPPSPEAYSATQIVTTLAYDFDNERTMAGRLVAQKGKTNFYLAYRQRVRTGTDAYVIFGDPNADSTRSAFTLKLISLL